MALNDYFAMMEALASSEIEGIEVSKIDREALILMPLFPDPITFEEAKKLVKANKKNDK